ncbi:transposase [Planomonospora parontospora subsp. parontospora]|uniref:Transposase n=2 Tax=Planomonospora parontospora TaxID=58119 RepID=A0AA37F5K1_9ACTN|nr:transposase [Planomonospora parontospora]GII09979.1 transposase [Planomonospora parontospora subsp. parontospora]
MAVKVYSAEFKADAVALYLSGPARTYASVAEDLGVNRETLRLRVQQARAAGTVPAAAAPARPAAAEVALEQENEQLRTRIRELEIERDILRRAAEYFAGETN